MANYISRHTGAEIDDAVDRVDQLYEEIDELKGEDAKSDSIFPRDIDAWVVGSLNADSGAETDSTYRLRTNFIPVSSDTTYDVTNRTPGYAIMVRYYDAAQKFIRVYVEYINTDFQFVTPANCAFVRFLVRVGEGVSHVQLSDINGADIYIAPHKEHAPYRLRVMSYNIGNFGYGSSVGLPSDTYEEKLLNYKKFFSAQKCDVIGVQECAEYIDAEKTVLSNVALWNPLYKYRADVANWTCIKSKFELRNTATGKLTASGRPYSSANVIVDNKSIYLLCVHFSPAVDNAVAIRQADYAELQTMIADKPYYIVFGDFNALTVAEYDNISVGDKANGGYLGYRWTHSYSADDYDSDDTGNYGQPSGQVNYFDNIFVSSNIFIENSEVMNVYSDLSSDHLPIVADLLIY